MRRKRWFLFGVALWGLGSVCGAAPVAPPPRPAPAPQKAAVLDVSKDKVELPLKQVVAAGAAPANQPARADRGKGVIELPVKATLAQITAPAPAPAPAPVVASADNPKVEPGKVRWHKDIETACAASRASGKPVLVFHMMGKLDDRFC